MADLKVWRKATKMDRLVGDTHVRLKKKTLKTAASITIATWLDEIHELRRRITLGKTESIILSCADPEKLREADKQFKRKINTARGITIWKDRQGVGERAVDMSTEKPPD